MERILTKFVPPLEPIGLLDRPRLREILTSVSQHRMTVIKAPAGYGKTTLLAQWHDELRIRGESVAWLSLDRQEATPSALAGAVAAMLAPHARAGNGLDPFFRNEACFKMKAVVATLVERLAASSRQVYLFFDDLHALGPDSAALFLELAQRAPLNTRFVTATRNTCGTGLAAMRAYGRLLEIGLDELRFTVQEAAALLAGAGHGQLSEAEIEALVQKTEGWVAGLKLAAFAMHKERDPKKFLSSFSGRRRTVADFFAEDVFADQHKQVRDFLLGTAMLDRLGPALCDAVTKRQGSGGMLRHLEEIGLFIVALDDEGNWYRYHSLFSEFLQRKLAEVDPKAAAQQHRRAALWFASQGSHIEAMQHALDGGDFELLASFLEQVSEDFISTGRLRWIFKFAKQLPKAVLARSPWTLAAVAWMNLRGLRFDATEHLLKQARSRLEQLRRDHAMDDDQLEMLERTIQHREMMLAAARDDLSRVEDQSGPLLNYFTQRHSYITCTIQAELITARREQFRFDGLPRLQMQCRALAEESGYRFVGMSLQVATGLALFAAGRTETAQATLRRGLNESHRFAGKDSSLGALHALPLAEIAYEGNDLSAAAELIETYLPVARKLCFVDQLMAGYLVHARLAGARGDFNAAASIVAEGKDLALECDLERLRLAMLHEQVRLSLRAGQPTVASREAQEAGASTGAAERYLPQPWSTTRDEIRALIRTRILISQDRLSDALVIAKGWRSFCQHRGAVRSLVRWQLLLAQAHMIDCDLRTAQRAMREAVACAAPALLVRSFVDEGPAVLTILSEAYQDSMASQHPTDVFAHRVLEAFDCRRPLAEKAVSTEEGLYGRLSAKELEILTLVGCGMRNREIGNRLGLSEGSVKWYMQQVYDKVGMRRRSQAVERARQFGLIA